MRKLKELINTLCPIGVEYRTVGDVCNICRGVVMSKDFIRDNAGTYPVYSSQTENNGELGKISTYNFDGEYLTWTTDGANAGSVFYRNGKFSVTNVCGVLEMKDNNILAKFLFYVLQTSVKLYVNKGMGNPKLMSNVMARVKIPVPPIEVQREIVRILDKFTELTSELTSELTARKKQYEYYRNELLNEFSNSSKMRICEFAKCVTGATPATGKKEYWENGTIQWMSSGEVNLFEIFGTEKKITQLGYEKCSTTIVPKDTVVIALAGQGKTRGKVAITRTSLCTNQSLCSIIVDEQIVDSEYLLFYLQSQYEDLRRISSGDGTRGGLNLKMINNYIVPVPSLAMQKEIIMKLKYFSKLCNDLSQGLPAEIAARKKQYEYYRDRLLAFQEKAV